MAKAETLLLVAGKGRRLPPPPHFDDLAEDGERDFCRCLSGDIESDGCVNPVDNLFRDFLFVTESLKTCLDPPLAADHADILRLAVNNLPQASLVVFLPSSNKGEISRRRDRHFFKLWAQFPNQPFIPVRE